MGAFDEAVHHAVNIVQPLVQALDHAHTECTDALPKLQTLAERLAQDRHELEDAVSHLTQSVQQAEQALAGAVTGTTGNLQKVAKLVGDAAHEWEEMSDTEQTALTGAAELLPELATKVKEMADKMEEASQGVLDWTVSVSQKLAEAVESVEQLVSVTLGAMMADWKRELEATVTHLTEAWDKEQGQHVIAQEAEFLVKAHEIHDALGHAFEAMANHEQEVAYYTAQKWDQLKEHEIETVQVEAGSSPAHELAQALSTLGQAASNYEGELEVAAGMVAEGQQHVATAANELAHALLEVRGRWGTFGINC